MALGVQLCIAVIGTLGLVAVVDGVMAFVKRAVH